MRTEESYFDIIGNRYGRWVVLDLENTEIGREVKYKCRCDCGTFRTVSRRNLIRGTSKSCGCLKSELLHEKTGSNHPNFKDLTGQRFGRLLVLEDSGKRKRGQSVIWKCKCDCGNFALVSGHSLIRGNTKSCGCFRKDCAAENIEAGVGERGMDIAGMSFGNLVVLEKTPKRSRDGCVVWKCKCSCGNEKEVASIHLLSGKVKSCGCLKEKNRIESLSRPSVVQKHKEISTKLWPEAKAKIGMQDGTNVSLIKSQKARIDSSTGVRGVYKKKNTYVARLTFQGKNYYEYGYKSVEDAAKARGRMYDDIVKPYLESTNRSLT